MKKVGMVSLGCAKNRVDSENMLGMLREKGFEIVADPAEADVLFVNTCGFIERLSGPALSGGADERDPGDRRHTGRGGLRAAV